MQGFGIQTKNIDELIKKIEQEIAFITKNIDKSIVILNNKLSYCSAELNNLKEEFAALKTHTEAEIANLLSRFESLLEEVEHLKDNVIKVEFNDDEFSEKVASGIAPLKEYDITHKTHPIFAKYADKDISGRDITGTYLTSGSTVIDKINQEIAANSANIATMSSTIADINSRLGIVENKIENMNGSGTFNNWQVITAWQQKDGKVSFSGTNINTITNNDIQNIFNE